MDSLYLIVLPRWFFIFILSLAQEIIFWKWKSEIFNWNPQNGLSDLVNITKGVISEVKSGDRKIKQEWKNIKEVYNSAPPAWKIYRFILELLGIFVGWNLILFFINKFSQLQFRHAELGSLWNLLLVLILGLVGIAGRIPTIVDSVQQWIKK